MLRSRLFGAYGPFLICWLLDYLIKNWFAETNQSFNFGFVNFAYVENHGIIMGNLSRLPLMLKTVFLSTLGVALVASLPVLLSLIQFRLQKTVLGLTLVLSGIIGNVTDRIIYGFVVDFIYFRTPYFTTPVFNLADAVQWLGYGLLVVGLYHEINYHYPDNDKRSGGWINRPYQLRFSFSLLAIFSALQFTLSVFGYTFVKYTLIELNLNADEISRYLNYYAYTSLVVFTFSSLVILLIGKMISHRIAGPAYAIKRYLKDTMLGKKYPLKFRQGDHLTELEQPLTEMNERLAKPVGLTLVKNEELENLPDLPDEEEIPEIPEEAKKCA